MVLWAARSRKLLMVLSLEIVSGVTTSMEKACTRRRLGGIQLVLRQRR
jgi:hypothetical protein